jgi:hypothetical protein
MYTPAAMLPYFAWNIQQEAGPQEMSGLPAPWKDQFFLYSSKEDIKKKK